MKNTRYNEATNMETVLINHQNDYIAYDGKIKTGGQWLDWLRKMMKKHYHVKLHLMHKILIIMILKC